MPISKISLEAFVGVIPSGYNHVNRSLPLLREELIAALSPDHRWSASYSGFLKHLNVLNGELAQAAHDMLATPEMEFIYMNSQFVKTEVLRPSREPLNSAPIDVQLAMSAPLSNACNKIMKIFKQFQT